MPNPTTAERLAQFMLKLKTKVEEYIKKIAASNIQNAFCVITPTQIKAPGLTHDQLERLK